MAAAGLGDDLLLANEVVDPGRLARLAALDARVTSPSTPSPPSTPRPTAGLREVVIDVYVGMPRCGCPPERRRARSPTPPAPAGSRCAA